MENEDRVTVAMESESQREASANWKWCPLKRGKALELGYRMQKSAPQDDTVHGGILRRELRVSSVVVIEIYYPFQVLY